MSLAFANLNDRSVHFKAKTVIFPVLIVNRVQIGLVPMFYYAMVDKSISIYILYCVRGLASKCLSLMKNDETRAHAANIAENHKVTWIASSYDSLTIAWVAESSSSI